MYFFQSALQVQVRSAMLLRIVYLPTSSVASINVKSQKIRKEMWHLNDFDIQRGTIVLLT